MDSDQDQHQSGSHFPTGAGEGVSIEAANWKDVGALRALEQVCFPKDAWPLLDLVGVLTMPNVLRLKAVNSGQLVGFIACDIRQSEKVAWISTVGVLPEYRGRGIGESLMREVEARVHVSAIRLSVRVSNHIAIRLYQRLGYYQKNIWPRYYSDREDAVVMEKLIQPGMES
jgi:ribosomal protein S18 acetylase RimI-like enzyme